MVRGGKLLGTIRVSDTIRPEAPAAVHALREMGINTILLTGEVARSPKRSAVRSDSARCSRNCCPMQRSPRSRGLGDEGRIVAMVGDGINDAPALTEAAVGIAMGSGTDVARESADVVLLGNDLSKLVETIRIARRVHAIIRFNVAGTVVVDAVGVALAAFGVLNPVMAAVIHVGSELAFILNSARLLPAARKQGA